MSRHTLRTAALTLAGAAGVSAAVGAAVFFSGAYDVAADSSHPQLVHTLLETGLKYSVRQRARGIEAPPRDAADRWQRGAVCFRVHCVQCHGAPGVAPSLLGLSMQPLPGPLVDAAKNWRPRELVWITRHGVRMSGMPAWNGRIGQDDQWALAAFMQRLPALSPAQYAALPQPSGGDDCIMPPRTGSVTPDLLQGAAERGRIALQRHACSGCHVIPGVVGSQRHVGPPLAGFARRTLIAGRLDNTPHNLALWVSQPQHVDPASAMPDVGVGAADARAIAAYLDTLR